MALRVKDFSGLRLRIPGVLERHTGLRGGGSEVPCHVELELRRSAGDDEAGIVANIELEKGRRSDLKICSIEILEEGGG